MANTKISALPSATSASGGDLIPIVQSGANKSLTFDNLNLSLQAAISFEDSLVNNAGVITLVNDNPTPGNSMYYGTNSSGTLGYFSVGTGSVSAISIASANGFAGTSSGGATPILTLTTTVTGLLKGDGTTISAAVSGTDFVLPSGSITGTAANITGTSNSTLTTLPNLVLPTSQLSGQATLAQLPTIGSDTVLGNITGGSTTPTALSTVQLTSLIQAFSSSLSGSAPASGGGTVNFLRADGSWSAPPASGGTVTTISVVSVNGFAGTVANPTTTPAITLTTTVTGLLHGNGTSITAATVGNLTDSTSGADGITVTAGTGAVLGSGTSIAQTQASASTPGYLSSTDWSTFSSKQVAGNYATSGSGDVAWSAHVGGGAVTTSIIATSNSTLATLSALVLPYSQVSGAPAAITALTGDGTASGPGSVAFTLATVNANVGSFGGASTIPIVTVNAKGLVTAVSSATVIAPAGTLTGTTLASNVVTSSLTSVGLQAQALNMNGHQINNVANGTSTNDAINLGQLQSAIAGLSWEGPAQAYADSNVPLTGLTPLLIDGYTVLNGDLVILGHQTTASQNGEYSVAITGGSYAMTPNGLPNAAGDAWLIVNGTVYADSAFVANAAVPAATFTEFAGPTAYIFTSPLVLTGRTVSITQATTSTNGYLSSTDWNTFNSKQAAGNYITGLTGDGTASGPGSVAFTLATVNSSPGTFASVTVNAKGLVTAAANLSGDATTAGAVLTLASVATAGTTGSSTAIPVITINAKGLVTGVSTAVVVAPAGTLTGTTLATNVVSSSLTSVGTIATGVWQGSQIGIAYGGTNNASAYTAGSIIFSNGTSLIQNNSNLFWDNTNFTLGLGGTPQAASILTGFNSSGSARPIWLVGYGVGSSTGVRGDFSRGTSIAPAAAQSGDILNFISGRGYGTSAPAATSSGVIQIVAGETFTNTSSATYIAFKTTPTTTVTAVEAMRINSTGNILIGTTSDAGQKLQVTGTAIISSTLTMSVAPIISSLTGFLYGNAASAVTAVTTIPVANGGTGVASLTAYALLAGGTTSTGALQQISGTGTLNQVLTSNGPGTLPTWQGGASGLSEAAVWARVAYGL